MGEGAGRSGQRRGALGTIPLLGGVECCPASKERFPPHDHHPNTASPCPSLPIPHLMDSTTHWLARSSAT